MAEMATLLSSDLAKKILNMSLRVDPLFIN
jgi:hypothetical protein